METNLKSKAFQEFSNAAETLVNPVLQRWKDQGGKVVGYFCSTVPEEIITAAGLTPFRMRATGSTGTEESDAFYSSINCSFPRHCFNQVLTGDFKFLDGIVCVNSCDHVRRIYDNWKRFVPTDFIEMMSLPRKTGPDQVGWYTEELAMLKDKVGKHFGVEITDDRLWKAVKLHNETRRLQKKLYELRKQEKPPITGAETLGVMVAGTAMPKEQYNEKLRELLDELSGTEGPGGHRARLLIVGGILDDPAYIKVIEDQGGLVVTDSTCFGSRLMWVEVDENASDPISALAQYYLTDRPSCPRMYGEHDNRAQYVIDMYREFNCDGVIGERLIFCDSWLVEHYMLGQDLKAAGIPMLKLDREYLTSGIGQLRTRVQAFLETMGR
ncbi:MAG: 2-hydroxyacyl-CoA dehydratase family protein [Dehalococcoidia bacterium]|nr:2-hydroxyacyl-CoA dehydratase family protein [Dehalococcoidia bacterium]